jgi:hypothetical protein
VPDHIAFQIVLQMSCVLFRVGDVRDHTSNVTVQSDICCQLKAEVAAQFAAGKRTQRNAGAIRLLKEYLGLRIQSLFTFSSQHICRETTPWMRP